MNSADQKAYDGNRAKPPLMAFPSHLIKLILGIAAIGSLTAQLSKPDLSKVTASERSMIEGACNLDKSVGGPAAYYGCLNNQLNLIRRANTEKRSPVEKEEMAETPLVNSPQRKSVTPAKAQLEKNAKPVNAEVPESPDKENKKITPESPSAEPQKIEESAKQAPGSERGERFILAMAFLIPLVWWLKGLFARLHTARETWRSDSDPQRGYRRFGSSLGILFYAVLGFVPLVAVNLWMSPTKTLSDVLSEILVSLLLLAGFVLWLKGFFSRMVSANEELRPDTFAYRFLKAIDLLLKRVLNWFEAIVSGASGRGNDAGRGGGDRPKGEQQGSSSKHGEQQTSNGNTTENRDPYQVLGIRPGATKAEIRAAYLSAISKCHPDKVAHLDIEFQNLAKAKAIKIIEAYELLHR